MMMKIWASRVVNANGIEDMEFFDSEPADSLIDELFDAFVNGDIKEFTIREGNINGGDSIVTFSSLG